MYNFALFPIDLLSVFLRTRTNTHFTCVYSFSKESGTVTRENIK